MMSVKIYLISCNLFEDWGRYPWNMTDLNVLLKIQCVGRFASTIFTFKVFMVFCVHKEPSMFMNIFHLFHTFLCQNPPYSWSFCLLPSVFVDMDELPESSLFLSVLCCFFFCLSFGLFCTCQGVDDSIKDFGLLEYSEEKQRFVRYKWKESYFGCCFSY